MPLYNFFRRFGSPLGRFHRIVEPVEFPEYRDASAYILGVRIPPDPSRSPAAG